MHDNRQVRTAVGVRATLQVQVRQARNWFLQGCFLRLWILGVSGCTWSTDLTLTWTFECYQQKQKALVYKVSCREKFSNKFFNNRRLYYLSYRIKGRKQPRDENLSSSLSKITLPPPRSNIWSGYKVLIDPLLCLPLPPTESIMHSHRGCKFPRVAVVWILFIQSLVLIKGIQS